MPVCSIVVPAFNSASTLGLVFDSKTLGGQLDLHRYLSSVGWKHDYGTLKPIIRKEFITATGLSYNLEARFPQDFYFLLDFFLSGALRMFQMRRSTGTRCRLVHY